MGTATKEDLERWWKEGKRQKATHLIIGWDWFDHDNFPIYVMPGESCRDRVDTLLESGNKYDEVYDLRMSKERQFKEVRAIHIPEDSLKNPKPAGKIIPITQKPTRKAR